MGNKIPYLVFP